MPPVAALPPASGDPAVEDVFNLPADTETLADPPGGYPTTLGDDPTDTRPAWQKDTTYTGIAELILDDRQVGVLTAPVVDAEIEIKPDTFGAVYLCHASYRKRLNEAFRPGGWAQRQISEWRYDDVNHVLSAEFALYARGADGKVCYVSKAIGGQEYWGGKGRSKMTYDDAAQGAESNALTRNCKQLGVALECWEKRTATAFRNRLGVLVHVDKGGDRTIAWRRFDEPRLQGETGVHDNSPNREKYHGPKQAETKTASSPQSAQPQSAAQTAKPQTASGPAAAQSSSGPTEYGTKGYITEKQAKMLWAVIKNESGMTEQAVAAHLKAKYNVTSSKQIKSADFNAIIKWLKGAGD